jgi:hypothetical protein
MNTPALIQAFDYVSDKVDVPNDIWIGAASARIFSTVKYDPAQPRVPAGDPDGGQWTSERGRSFRNFKDFKEAEDWAKQHNNDVFPELSAKQKDLLDNYKRNSLYYKPLNKYLRTGKYDPEESAWGSTRAMMEATREIDAAIKASEIPEDIIVFRGMPSELLPKNAVGAEFTDKGYGSTSLDFEMADKFAKWTREDGFTPAIIEIKVPKGSDGIYMENLWDNGESELLLPRGTKYKITSDTYQTSHFNEKVRYLTVEVVK